MFREIRTSERITDRDRRIKEERQRELDNIRRIAGRHYSEQEVNEAKQFVINLFNKTREESEV